MWDNTPLLLACQYGYKEIALYLIEKGSQINVFNEKGCSPLLYASLEGQEDIIKYILKSSQITSPLYEAGLVYNAKKDRNLLLSPLEAASINNHSSILSILLKNGYNPNVKSICKITQEESVLKEMETNISLRIHSSLSLACKEGHLIILNMLLEANAQIELIDENENESLLMLSALSGNDKALLRMLNTKANESINYIGKNKLSVLYVAASLGLVSSVKLLIQVRVLFFLYEKGFYISLSFNL